jgi:hypothetical protein
LSHRYTIIFANGLMMVAYQRFSDMSMNALLLLEDQSGGRLGL